MSCVYLVVPVTYGSSLPTGCESASSRDEVMCAFSLSLKRDTESRHERVCVCVWSMWCGVTLSERSVQTLQSWGTLLAPAAAQREEICIFWQ